MTVYRIDLAYDGSVFHGYAAQPGMRTVQGDLEAALAPFIRLAGAGAGGPVETVVAGRTDKGVHATGQVVSFSADVDLDLDSVRRSLNGRLAPAVAVRSIAVAPDGFMPGSRRRVGATSIW